MVSDFFNKLIVIKHIALSLALFAASAVSAFAQSAVTIQDTAGFTRAVSEVEQAGKVEFNLLDAKGSPADGVSIQLLNAATGETIAVTAVNGVAVVESLTPGVWTVSTATPGITFTNVAITSIGLVGAGAAAGSAAAIAIVGTAAVAGGTVAITEANDNDSKAEPVSPFS